jgi:hypothetical protein
MPIAETIEAMKAVRRRQRSQAAGATTRPHWCGGSQPNRPRIARQSTWLTGAQQLVALPLARAS